MSGRSVGHSAHGRRRPADPAHAAPQRDGELRARGRAYLFVVARTFLVGLLVAALLVVVGLLGAAAFNPDDGFLVPSEPLWRLFGITAYLGLGTAYLLPILAIGRLVFLLVRRLTRVSGRAVCLSLARVHYFTVRVPVIPCCLWESTGQ